MHIKEQRLIKKNNIKKIKLDLNNLIPKYSRNEKNKYCGEKYNSLKCIFFRDNSINILSGKKSILIVDKKNVPVIINNIKLINE